jgi:hypothetical protein
MFIPLNETPTEYREGGEERNNFYFYLRDSSLPVEVKITRLPAKFDYRFNWHRHKFIEEYSVPLTGEIIVYEEENGKAKEKHLKEAILKPSEWVLGIECNSRKRVKVLVEDKNGKRRNIPVEFEPKYTEGKNWHSVGNPTNQLVTMITLKRAPRSIFKKDPLIFKVDREKLPDYRTIE